MMLRDFPMMLGDPGGHNSMRNAHDGPAHSNIAKPADPARVARSATTDTLDHAKNSTVMPIGNLSARRSSSVFM